MFHTVLRPNQLTLLHSVDPLSRGPLRLRHRPQLLVDQRHLLLHHLQGLHDLGVRHGLGAEQLHHPVAQLLPLRDGPDAAHVALQQHRQRQVQEVLRPGVGLQDLVLVPPALPPGLLHLPVGPVLQAEPLQQGVRQPTGIVHRTNGSL